MTEYHIPVLANEVLEYIGLEDGLTILDGTLGGGGHASLILDKGHKLEYLGLDQDKDALAHVKTKLVDERLSFFHGSFFRAADVLGEIKQVDRILLDLGVSSYQLDMAERGFSYMNDGPLDMRMNQNDDNALTAKQILQDYDAERLADIFYNYGDERKSRIIAAEIIKRREESPLETTKQLVDLIHEIIYGNYQNKQSSVKRVFQSLRIEVNSELSALEQALKDLWDLLAPGGRILVITFHSLEDRIVKNVFKTLRSEGDGLRLVKGSSVSPKWEEVQNNSRAKSARLRGIMKN